MSKRFKQAAILLGILVLPSLFYVILSTGEHQIGRAPFFGPKQLHPTKKIKRDIPDTIYYQVPDISFVTLEGEPKQLSDIGDKLTILHFYCLSCYESNFRVIEQIGKLHERFKDKPEVTILSVAIDSSDTKENLLELPDYSIGAPNWKVWRLVGDWKNIATDALLMNESHNKNGLDQSTLVILDGKRHIRGYFDGKQYVETNAAIDAIKALRFSYYRPVKKQK